MKKTLLLLLLVCVAVTACTYVWTKPDGLPPQNDSITSNESADDGYLFIDPEQCALVRFKCHDGQEAFFNESGCGCISSTTWAARDPTTCAATDWICPSGKEQFYNESGCGCKPSEPLVERGVYCTPEQKQAEACTLQYDPVCGYDASGNIVGTGGNICGSCATPDVAYYIPGECPQKIDDGGIATNQVYCTPEQVAQQGTPVACTKEYNPVCGWFNKSIQCFDYPCAVPAGNPCDACATEGVEYYTAGACPDSGLTDNTMNSCEERYWFDDTNKDCGKKRFCGAYMYYGLYTYATQAECLQALTE